MPQGWRGTWSMIIGHSSSCVLRKAFVDKQLTRFGSIWDTERPNNANGSLPKTLRSTQHATSITQQATDHMTKQNPNPILPSADEKPVFVNNMFARIAPTYDRMNRLMAMGQDQGWRRLMLEQCNLPAAWPAAGHWHRHGGHRL